MSGKTAISPTREQDYSEWYQQVVRAADMAENAPVRGCMIIKPWGYGVWENIRDRLDKRFHAKGVRNAYFPLLIPLEFLQKEADHVEGFATETAVVTHHRLEKDENGKLVPAGELTEPYIIRPTSETIIGESMAKWINSYRDLPMLLNQWANVMRWEMRPRIFLRTAEFLWQEGHTAHASKEDAQKFTREMLDVYADFVENELAMPVIKGEKIASERFPGAVDTLTVESMMQDRKALQNGTSHFLGQNFSRAANIKFATESGSEELVWTTSWGVSTRLIGSLIMVHGDDDGMVMPPNIAPAQIAIIPIIRDDAQQQEIMAYCQSLYAELLNQNLRVELDQRQIKSQDKNWDWIKRGVPIRLEIGARDIENNKVFMAERDLGQQGKKPMDRAEFVQTARDILATMQKRMLDKARAYMNQNLKNITSKDELYEFFTPKKDEIHGGFALCHWNGDEKITDQLKTDLKLTVRCIPYEYQDGSGKCIFTGEPSPQKIIIAKAY